MEHYRMIGKLCNDKIELGGCFWLWLVAQLCVSHPCPLITKATGPFQLNTAVKLRKVKKERYLMDVLY